MLFFVFECVVLGVIDIGFFSGICVWVCICLMFFKYFFAPEGA